MSHSVFRNSLIVPFGFCLILSSAVCASDKPPQPAPDKNIPVISHADGVIGSAEIRAALLGATPDQQRKLQESPSSAEVLASDLLIRRLVAVRANKEGLDRDPNWALRLQLAREKNTFDLYMERAEAAAIDEKKIDRLARDEYRAYPERYRQEEVRAHHILVREAPSRGDDARKVAEALLARLTAGESFEELATKYSDDPGSAAKGGDLGWLAKGKTVKPFEDALFALKKPGELSEIIASQFGFHIIRLDEVKPVALQPYDEVKGVIIEGITNNIRRQTRQAIIGPLKSSESLKLDQKALREALNTPSPK